MITLFITLYSLLFLCTAGNASDVKELLVKTAKRGENVTMECHINMTTNKNNLVWYRQGFGKVPQFLAKPYSSTLGYTFDTGFNAIRFSITVNDQKFDLNINTMKEEDSGEYFCGELEGNMIWFTSGTRLEFQAEETERHPATKMITDSVALQCVNSSSVEDQMCTPNMHVFLWLSISRIGVLFITVIILIIYSICL